MPTTKMLVIAAASICLSTASFAHAFLSSASPAVGSTVKDAPTQVSLHFTEGLEPLFSTIEVQDRSGARVDSGKPTLAPNDSKQFSVSLKQLLPGTYRVIWHATSVDTHKTEGNYSFTVQP